MLMHAREKEIKRKEPDVKRASGWGEKRRGCCGREENDHDGQLSQPPHPASPPIIRVCGNPAGSHMPPPHPPTQGCQAGSSWCARDLGQAWPRGQTPDGEQQWVADERGEDPPEAQVSPDRADDRLHRRHDVIHRELALVALLLCHFLGRALWKVRGPRWWQQKGPLPPLPPHAQLYLEVLIGRPRPRKGPEPSWEHKADRIPASLDALPRVEIPSSLHGISL